MITVIAPVITAQPEFHQVDSKIGRRLEEKIKSIGIKWNWHCDHSDRTGDYTDYGSAWFPSSYTLVTHDCLCPRVGK